MVISVKKTGQKSRYIWTTIRMGLDSLHPARSGHRSRWVRIGIQRHSVIFYSVEGPVEWSENLKRWTDEYKSIVGGSLPAVTRNGVEIMAMIDPSLE